MPRKKRGSGCDAVLTDKELAFAVEYSRDWNKKQAAIRAGYSEDCAAEVGFELANKPHVLRKVRSIQNERAKRLELSVEWAVDQFYELYIEARAAQDRKTANKVMENIAKIAGAFLKDNEQKHGIKSDAEAEAIREKLRARGVSFETATTPSTN